MQPGPHMPTKAQFGASFAGILIMMLGTAIITRSGLGTAPVSSPVWVASLIGGLSFGGWTFVVNVCFIVAQKLLLREAFPKHALLQLPALVVASASLDGWMWLLRFIQPNGYFMQLVTVLAGIGVLGVGVAFLAAARALFLPGEGLVSAIADVRGVPFAKVKLPFDITCVLTALVLAFVFLHDLSVIREATVMSALLLGPVAGLFIPALRRRLHP
ncbi:DUF6198 family protein [Corynebacterium felinum]|uniref:Membrane protein YczE n=1 Tax=Corynebacterium felinum TaxID=131318 RepID=A0ABU2B7L5_9CORY|nr:DUF6198 family protein [Corynebacterium felinum]MDF5820886.1 DUF6198 family protein [Corynebacterium felinum]MDR7354602.1 putative membrane protein YczE [Corynebacterium felinum]WJY93967.1 hypothetical protein CFELI_01620 [Corynebacterium felinum]